MSEDKPCTHANVDHWDGLCHIRRPSPDEQVRCVACHQKFGPMQPTAEFSSIQDLFGRHDIVRHVQALAREAIRLGVRIEFDTNIRSPDFGAVLGVRRPMTG